MKAYGDYNGTSGIKGYFIDPADNYMEIEYASGRVYTYTKRNVGEVKFGVMKALAINGRGLNGYINEHVRGRGRKRGYEPEPELVTVTLIAKKADVGAMVTELLNKFDVEFTVS